MPEFHAALVLKQGPRAELPGLSSGAQRMVGWCDK